MASLNSARWGGIMVLAAAALHVTVSGQQPADQSLKALTAADGLELTLWAGEPSISNPTNIAIDERGRIWVLEAVNYRRQLRGQPDIRATGDRIVILEDTNLDGRADKTTVFDEGPHLRAPLGIAVLGNRVVVSQSPDLIVYTKDAGDRVVRREVLLTGWGGVDHDHGLHAVVFGPDGRYYFNAGNEGFDVTDRAGHRVRSPKPGGPGKPDFGPGQFFEGVVMAMEPDGTGLEVLAQNFRNPYEVAIDAFGDLWQTDNDDDGNAWTRANYVMAGGNYGFRGPYGRTWREDRGSHFHEESPGVVPNLLRLGPGSPCGLIVYEGRLLPERYRGHLLHAEAGRRVIARYPLTPDGAGFSSRVDEIVFGGNDTWFRPSDVAVAPDGAVFIADWYDPAVGGHGMGDAEGARGRIYRLAPRGHAARAARVDVGTDEGVAAALGSPAPSVFYLAHTEIVRRGTAALPLLQKLSGGRDALLRARSLWLIGRLGEPGLARVREALSERDPRFRTLALRVLQRSGADMAAVTAPLLRDPSPQVRREIALMLQDRSRMTPAYAVGPQETPTPALLDALTGLAAQFDGRDRWYLAALGVAARGREDALYGRLRTLHRDWNPALALLLRELRAPASLPYVLDTLRGTTSESVRVQALDVLEVMPSLEAERAVEALILAPNTPLPLASAALGRLRRQLFSLWTGARGNTTLPAVVEKALATPALQAAGVELASALGDGRFDDALVRLATGEADAALRAAAVDAVAISRDRRHLATFDALLRDGPAPVRIAAMNAITMLAPADLDARAEAVLLGSAPNEARSEAVRVLARSADGLTRLSALAEGGTFPPELKRLATTLVHAQFRRTSQPGNRGSGSTPPDEARARLAEASARAAKAFPSLPTANSGTLPSVRQMEQEFRADPAGGRKVFDSLCAACHSLGGERRMGPDLSAIGTKLDRQALLDAIVMPSAAISFGYESWTVETKSRGALSGLLIEDTPERVTLKVDATQEVRLAPADITGRRSIPVSTMPEGLVEGMTPQQITDLVAFLATQRAR